MRIFAISPFANTSRREILDFLSNLPQGLIVLPGHCGNTPSPRQVQRVIAPGAMAFVEGLGRKVADPRRKKNRPGYIVRKRSITRMPSQIFKASPTANQMKQLVAILPQRTVAVGKRKASFIICGEILAFNPDGSTKHQRTLDVDILINPTHTPMGRWGQLGKKLKRLSRGSVVVHVANNNRNHHLTSDVRIYKNGRLRKRHRGKKIAWSECRI
jgi:hypothetical protein